MCIKANIKKEKCMEKEYINSVVVKHIMENGLTEIWKENELCDILMEFMKGIGKMIKEKEKENSPGLKNW